MRGFNVSEFRSEVEKRGMMRTNKYLVEFFMPTGMVDTEGSDEMTSTVRSLEFWVESSTIPGTNLITHDARRYGYGPIERRPVAPMFMDCTMSVVADAEGQNWQFFKRWQQIIANFDARNGMNTVDSNTSEINYNGNITTADPYEIAYRTEYISDVRIIVFDLDGFPTKVVVLREAFPINVGDIAISWSDNNSIMKFPIILSYLDFFTSTYEGYEPLK